MELTRADRAELIMFYQPSFRDSISAFLRRKGLFMLAFGVLAWLGARISS